MKRFFAMFCAMVMVFCFVCGCSGLPDGKKLINDAITNTEEYHFSWVQANIEASTSHNALNSLFGFPVYRDLSLSCASDGKTVSGTFELSDSVYDNYSDMIQFGTTADQQVYFAFCDDNRVPYGIIIGGDLPFQTGLISVQGDTNLQVILSTLYMICSDFETTDVQTRAGQRVYCISAQVDFTMIEEILQSMMGSLPNYSTLKYFFDSLASVLDDSKWLTLYVTEDTHTFAGLTIDIDFSEVNSLISYSVGVERIYYSMDLSSESKFEPYFQQSEIQFVATMEELQKHLPERSVLRLLFEQD